MEKTYLIEDRRWNDQGIRICNYGTEDDHLKWVIDNTSHSYTNAIEEQGYKVIKQGEYII